MEECKIKLVCKCGNTKDFKCELKNGQMMILCNNCKHIQPLVNILKGVNQE